MKNFQENNFVIDKNGHTIELTKEIIESKFYNEDDYTPIPLDSEQLEKLGFIKQYERVFRKGQHLITWNPETPNRFQIRSQSFIVSEPSFVHEIQNYFKEMDGDAIESPVTLPTMEKLNKLDIVGRWANDDKSFSVFLNADGSCQSFIEGKEANGQFELLHPENSGNTCLLKLTSIQLDIVIFSLNLPNSIVVKFKNKDGLEITQEIKK